MVKSKELFVQESNIAGAGYGLFTRVFIKKGEEIAEYKGRIITWKKAQNARIFNPYLMYLRHDYVIDARNYKSNLARFANDARGLQRVEGIRNNAKFFHEGNRVYIEALKNIKAGDEIFVGYGKDYWEVIKENLRFQDAAKK